MIEAFEALNAVYDKPEIEIHWNQAQVLETKKQTAVVLCLFTEEISLSWYIISRR